MSQLLHTATFWYVLLILAVAIGVAVPVSIWRKNKKEKRAKQGRAVQQVQGAPKQPTASDTINLAGLWGWIKARFDKPEPESSSMATLQSATPLFEKRTYRIIVAKGEKKLWEPIQGKPVVLIDRIEAFVHQERVEPGQTPRGWVISDSVTGLAYIGVPQPTVEAAIDEANQALILVATQLNSTPTQAIEGIRAKKKAEEPELYTEPVTTPPLVKQEAPKSPQPAVEVKQPVPVAQERMEPPVNIQTVLVGQIELLHDDVNNLATQIESLTDSLQSLSGNGAKRRRRGKNKGKIAEPKYARRPTSDVHPEVAALLTKTPQPKDEGKKRIADILGIDEE